jgi:hypothetical protein
MVVTLAVIGPLVLLLVMVNAFADHRQLQSAGVPRPWLIVRRRHLDFLPSTATAVADITGRRVWLSWDLRWFTAGQTMAVVHSFDALTGVLALELAVPIVVHATNERPGVELTRVEFIPRASGTPNYLRRAIPGSLRPEVSPGFAATATTVVFPAEGDA